MTFRFVSLNSYPTYSQQRKTCLWTLVVFMKNIARRIFLQLQLLVISHRRAVPEPAMITASPLIGTVPMTQKIQESMLDITFFSALAFTNWLLVCSWSLSKKWQATMAVSAFTFISPVSSSMIAPGLSQLAERFDVHSNVLLAMTISVFVLAYGENFHSHRRKPSLIARIRHPHHSLWALIPWSAQRNIWTLACLTTCQPVVSRYMISFIPSIIVNRFSLLVWNIACGFASSMNMLIVFRFLAGLGGSAPQSIGGGVIGDLFDAEHRGQAISIYSLAPLLGPVIGPVAGAWIAEKSTWRWVVRLCSCSAILTHFMTLTDIVLVDVHCGCRCSRIRPTFFERK